MQLSFAYLGGILPLVLYQIRIGGHERRQFRGKLKVKLSGFTSFFWKTGELQNNQHHQNFYNLIYSFIFSSITYPQYVIHTRSANSISFELWFTNQPNQSDEKLCFENQLSIHTHWKRHSYWEFDNQRCQKRDLLHKRICFGKIAQQV